MTGPRQAGPVRSGAADDVHPGEIDRIVAGLHHDPHAVLGAHPGPDGVVVRALLPLAATVAVVLDDGRRFPLSHLHEGVFAGTLPLTEVPDYRIAVAYPGRMDKAIERARRARAGATPPARSRRGRR